MQPCRSDLLELRQIQHACRRFLLAGRGIGDGRWARLLVAQLIIVQRIPGGRTAGAHLHQDIVEHKGALHFWGRNAPTAREIEGIITAQVGSCITATGPQATQARTMPSQEAEPHKGVPGRASTHGLGIATRR